jgi:(p)ppGpp synthase/HD superfamily hydrolase
MTLHRFPRLPAALDYAALHRDGQLRKGTNIPYLAHLLGVCALVLDYGGDEDQAIAGLLHDVIEGIGLR